MLKGRYRSRSHRRLFRRSFDKAEQWWDRWEMFSERGLIPLCSHDYFRNIQGYTLAYVHTLTVLYAQSLSEWVPEMGEERTGLMTCYFPFSFSSFFPRKDFFSIAMETTLTLYVKYIYLYTDSLGRPPQNTPGRSLPCDTNKIYKLCLPFIILFFSHWNIYGHS